MDCSTPGFPVHHQLPELAQTHVHQVMMPSNRLILCCPLLFLPSVFPSIRVFSNELALQIRWPNCWRFSFSISPSNEYSGLISFRIGWLELHVVQGTLKSFCQHHSSKASFLQCSAFFVVQISHLYMTTGKIYCCCSVTPSCLTLCDPMDCNTPGFPVLQHLLEFAQNIH